MSRSDPARVLNAKLTGCATGIRDTIAHAPPELVEAQRVAWPELWERLDRLGELV